MSQMGLDLRDAYSQQRRAEQLTDVVFDAYRARGTIRENAHDLDQIFGPLGRPVSESVLKAAMSPNSERNYPRFEWLVLVIDEPTVQLALRAPTMSPEEENRVTREYIAKNAPGLISGLNRALGRSS